jgi:hypothetical protein
MSIGEAAQMLVALTGVGTFLLTVRNGRQSKIERGELAHKIDAVHESTNGKMDALLKLTAKSSEAEGKAKEKANPT